MIQVGYDDDTVKDTPCRYARAIRATSDSGLPKASKRYDTIRLRYTEITESDTTARIQCVIRSEILRYNAIHTTDTGRYIITDTMPDTDVDTSLIRTRSCFCCRLSVSCSLIQSSKVLILYPRVSALYQGVSECIVGTSIQPDTL